MTERSENYLRYATPSLIYQSEVAETSRMLDVWGGCSTLREGRQTYLPKSKFETDEDYELRLRTLAIKNYLQKAIIGHVGRIFSKETTLGNDVSAEARKWLEDIDLRGNKGDAFWKKVVTAGIRDGISWVLVDMPVNPASNLAEERALGIRPYCRLYQKIDVIFVQEANNRIVDFRVRETSYEVRDMQQVKIEKIRRLTPGTCEIYNITDDTLEVLETTYPAEFGVPVVPYITDPDPGAGLSTEPPLKDMAELIIRLWRSQGEQDNSLSVARCPMLFGKCLNFGDDGLVVSAKSVVTSDDENASLSWVESDGSALISGEKDINTLKEEIDMEGDKPLKQDNIERTRYESRSDDAKVTSPIRNMADAAQDMIENVLEIMEIWVHKKAGLGGSVALNSNFELAEFDAEETRLLSNMRARGDITQLTYLKEMKRRGVLAEDIDIESEIEAAKAEDLSAFKTDPYEVV